MKKNETFRATDEALSFSNLLEEIDGLEWQDLEVVKAENSNGSQCGSCSGTCGSHECSFNPFAPGEVEDQKTLVVS